MTICEQFIRGSFNRIGTRFIPSPNLNDILGKKSIRYLKDLSPSQKLIQTWLPEGYVAISSVHNATDEYERSTVWNHTIVLSVQDYFKLHEEHDKTLFGRYFVDGLDKPPRSLEPLRVET